MPLVQCDHVVEALTTSGADQALHFAWPIFLMGSLTAFATAGRPVLPLRGFQVQRSRKPFWDQPTTVSGLTMMSGFGQPDHSLDKQAQKKRSTALRCGRFGPLW
jgi:hypothetical protein